MAANVKIAGAGSVIRRARETAGLSQRELAQRIKMPVSTLCRYESGERAIALEVVGRIAAGCGHPEEALVLECIRAMYPRLADTRFGALLEQIVNAIREIDANAARSSRKSQRSR